jgi:hypothetical protein
MYLSVRASLYSHTVTSKICKQGHTNLGFVNLAFVQKIHEMVWEDSYLSVNKNGLCITNVYSFARMNVTS